MAQETQMDSLDHIFSALGNPIRREIIAQIAEQQVATVSELADPFDVSLNAISKHLKVLERAGLIRREVKGREHYCRINSRALQDASEWLDYYRQFWSVRLDALEEAVIDERDDHSDT